MMKHHGNNNYYDDTMNIDIVGRDNNVGPGCDNVHIVGDGNKVIGGVRNVTLINTDGVTVFENNTLYHNGNKVISGIAQLMTFDIVDGGYDLLADPFQSALIAQLVDGGLDAVRGLNNINDIHTIDGNG